jgi:hypothetical protein
MVAEPSAVMAEAGEDAGLTVWQRDWAAAYVMAELDDAGIGALADPAGFSQGVGRACAYALAWKRPREIWAEYADSGACLFDAPEIDAAAIIATGGSVFSVAVGTMASMAETLAHAVSRAHADTCSACR